MKMLWVRISEDHGHACSVETIGSDMAIFRNSILTLVPQRQIWDILQEVKFSSSLVHKKNFSLIWQVVFKLGYVFCQEFEWVWVWMNSEKSRKQQ